MQYTFL